MFFCCCIVLFIYTDGISVTATCLSPDNGSAISRTVTDKQAEHRRLQGLLQGRPAEDRLATHGGTEEALPDTLGYNEDRGGDIVQGPLAFPTAAR